MHLYDDAFEDFVNRPDLPEFDFIGIHGIWSWISDEARQAMVDFVRRKLSVGGVLYISYNVHPGFLPMLPLRHLMKRYADLTGEGQGTELSVKNSIDFVNRLFALNPRYAQQNPLVQAQFTRHVAHDPHYVAHEFFNLHWDLMHFDEIAARLSEAKVQFAVSATASQNVDSINFTSAQREELSKIRDVNFKETVRDFLQNTQFRRDYFIKGVRRISLKEQQDALMDMSVILMEPLKYFTYKTRGNLGEVNLVGKVYEPILEVLSDHVPHRIGDILEKTADKGINYSSLISALVILMSKGSLALAQECDAALIRQCQGVNREILKRTASGQGISYMASPVTGSGVFMGQIPQLLVSALSEKKAEPVQESLENYLHALFSKAKVTLNVNGKSCGALSAEGKEEIRRQTERFVSSLPLYRNLHLL